ncbi:J-type chaperone JAC1 [Sporobolomyces koalae]|uniref:J-type chaperone JAC1 n=1 Tax=Sporobolomyces koalae TaxID=500713 RepID=UPI003170D4F5
MLQSTVATPTRTALRRVAPVATRSAMRSSRSDVSLALQPIRPFSTRSRLELPLKQAQPSSSTCPSCHAPLPRAPFPLCPKCSSIVPPPPLDSTTFYSLLQLAKQEYEIDLKHLKREFLQLQQKVHPDRFGGMGSKEEWAKLWSARVNDAYKVLANDRERGEYLLSLHDVTIGEAEAVTDPELLMEIMETREELEDAETPEQVDRIRETNRQSMQEAIRNLARAFDHVDPPDLETARNLIIQLKYLDNVETVCREWTPGKRVELQH